MIETSVHTPPKEQCEEWRWKQNRGVLARTKISNQSEANDQHALSDPATIALLSKWHLQGLVKDTDTFLELYFVFPHMDLYIARRFA